MAYRIICDEHIKQQVVTYLAREGHDAIHVETALSLSADDTDIAAYAREENRVVLTNDDDFINADGSQKSPFSTIRTTSFQNTSLQRWSQNL